MSWQKNGWVVDQFDVESYLVLAVKSVCQAARNNIPREAEYVSLYPQIPFKLAGHQSLSTAERTGVCFLGLFLGLKGIELFSMLASSWDRGPFMEASSFSNKLANDSSLGYGL
jgi:hypothetical protein